MMLYQRWERGALEKPCGHRMWYNWYELLQGLAGGSSDFVNKSDGTFVMYYSATSASYTTSHCIGAATSETAYGPFVAQDDVLVCPAS